MGYTVTLCDCNRIKGMLKLIMDLLSRVIRLEKKVKSLENEVRELKFTKRPQSQHVTSYRAGMGGFYRNYNIG
jgi:hypothetical protein